MTIKLIVGLANPKNKYDNTRHNVGSWYIDLLTKQFHVQLKEEVKFFGYTSCINLTGIDVHLLVPNTFMNLSGKAVVAMTTFYNINANEILVAHDELDLLPGIVKLRLGGNYNGHKGVKDIINKLDNNHIFYRLRVGIGRPTTKNSIADFVLSKPSTFERNMINKALNKAVYCTEIWLKNDFIKAINYLHTLKTGN